MLDDRTLFLINAGIDGELSAEERAEFEQLLAESREARTMHAEFLRLANLMELRHPMSVDTYVERMAPQARLIVVRALGGASYFSYALEALHGAAASRGIAMAVLPGDDKPDPGLAPFCTLPPTDVQALWA